MMPKKVIRINMKMDAVVESGRGTSKGVPGMIDEMVLVVTAIEASRNEGVKYCLR